MYTIINNFTQIINRNIKQKNGRFFCPFMKNDCIWQADKAIDSVQLIVDSYFAAMYQYHHPARCCRPVFVYFWDAASRYFYGSIDYTIL